MQISWHPLLNNIVQESPIISRIKQKESLVGYFVCICHLSIPVEEVGTKKPMR